MKTKKLFKSIVSLLLVVMMLMSVGIASISSAVVDLVSMGYDISAGKYVYFLDTGGWNACQMYLWKDSGGYNTYYTLSKIPNTKIYYYYFGSSWNGYSGFKFRSNTSWTKQSNGDIKTSVTDNSYWAGTGTTMYTTMANMNGTSKVVTMISTNGGTSYVATANSSVYTTVSGYNLAGGKSSATSVNASTTSANNASIEAAYGSTVTYTAVPGGATFKGFSTSNSSTLPTMTSTSTSYIRTATANGGTDNTTVYAYYILNSDVTATFKDHDGTVIDTVEVASGATPTAPADPTRDGYRFTGWSPELGDITEDTTYTAQYVKTYKVSASAEPTSGGTASADKSVVDTGASVTLTATADSANGYVFTGWTINGKEVGDATNSTLVVDNVTENITAVANFRQIPTYTVKGTVNNSAAGTVSPVNQEVPEGSKVDLTAVANTGYTFSNWVINGSYTGQSGSTTTPIYSIIVNGNITAQANFTAHKGTVTVNAQSGGTVTNAGTKATTYPDSVTSTASANTGYTFAGWDIKGGTLNTDYVVSGENTNTITVTPIKEGADITVTAKFLLGQYLTVYTFSEDGYDNLKLTESNGTTTNTVVDDEQSGVEYFGEVEWLRSDENMELTNGYSSSVTAVLSSASGNGNAYNEDNNTFLVKDGYRTIVFTNGWAWSEPTLHHWIDGGAGTSWPGEKMQKVGQNTSGQDIYVLYIPNDRQKVVFNGTNEKFQQSDDIVLPAGSNDVLAYCIEGSKANGHPNVVLWPIQPGTHTPSSGDIDLTSTLYNTDGTWANVDKVWIYQSGSTEIVTLRSALLKAIADSKSTFTAGNDGIWTDDSWSAFVAAYNTAVSTVGAGASTQEAIDAAAADLIAKKAALATQEKVSLSVTQQGATGTVSFGNVTIDTATGAGDVNKGKPVTLNITAPNMYYISGIIVNGESVFTNDVESLLEKEYTTSALSADNNYITVIYTARTTYTITVEAYGQDGGSLYFNGDLIPAAGNVYTVCSGDNVTITAEPADGYGVYYWVVDSTSGNNRELSYSFNNVSKNHTIDVEWVELQQVTVNVVTKPNSAGTSTVNGQSSFTVEQYSTVILTTTNTDPCYQFIGWTIEGAYYAAEGTTKNDTTFKIVASGTGTIKATANYDKVYKAIYLDNAAGWQQPYIYSWGSSSPVTAWPGDKMTYDSTLKWWVGYVPLDATNVQFNDGTNKKQKEFVIGTNNLFTNGNTTDYPATYIEEGYYLQGTWNGATHSAYDHVKFEEQADGTYTLELTVTKTADGYIYVNPTNELSHFWNAATNGATGNPQTLTATGASQSSPKQVKIEIDTTDFNKAYDLVITFNPTTREFSWTKAENVPTITINGSDGRTTNEADSNMDRVGDTSFDLDTVNRVNRHTYYDSAQVVAGTPVTFSTQVNPNGSGGYDYYVAGWVINGTEFVSATTMGSGLYTGSYVFADDANIIPVYFHTNEWLSANNVKTVTVYAVNNNNSITNWDDYMAAYTWYNVGGVTKYEQFGKYTGQVMIPVTGLDGVYYTYIETTSPDGVDISGITFNNHGDAENGYDVSHEVNYSHIQTYDYYEFMALLEDGKENITFVLKNTNDTYNASRVDGSAEDITNGNWDFVQYTDYSGLKTDIFGNDIEAIDSTLSDSDALYVIQAGDKKHSGVGHLDSQWSVDCYLYDATGKYLGKCYSYELHDEDSAIWTTLAAYEGQRAYISYEHVNKERYDGEWYGDANVSVTINLSVNVGLTTDGGKTYTENETSPVNVADYGTGYINVQYQNVDVTRGDTVTLTAMPKTGYKFVGWYSADGTCFTTNTTYTVTAAIGTTYTAVFDALDSGYYYVNHYIYQGAGTSTNYIPVPNGGNALLYVGIKNITTGAESGFSQTNTAYVKAQEGDELLITVATDAIGADEFYAWYVDAVDSTGTTFEEVGVDTDDNLAMSDENNPYYMTGVNTVVGAQDRVYFSFKYTVKDYDTFNMNIYSDLIRVSIDRILVYNYNDRYGNVKSYYVPYTLNQDEIEGFAGNGFTPMKPAYISSPTGEWENTVLVNAPFVDDYYKDATWIINQTMFDTQTISLWATHNYPTYTVTYTVGDTVLVQKVPYNSNVEIDARDHSTTARNAGFWYEEIIKNGVYDKGVDIILCYGATYMYRVTKDMVINYQAVEEFDFNIMIDAPVYGREQTTDSQGNNKKDTIYIDYLNNILTPYMYGDTDKVTGKVYDTVHFGGETLDEFWGADHVTVESLIAMGYDLEYGMILEWVGAGLITETNTLVMAQKKAESNGYGTATDEETLKNVIKNYSGTPNMANGGKYYTLLNVNNPTLTNKNRYLFTMTMSNTENNQGKFYNVYGYLKVKAPGSDTWSYYTSNVQTLNIYKCGTNDAATEDNTTFE